MAEPTRDQIAQEYVTALEIINRLRLERDALLQPLRQGYALSLYAAAIHFDGQPNTAEYLDELRTQIEQFQALALAAIEKAEHHD